MDCAQIAAACSVACGAQVDCVSACPPTLPAFKKLACDEVSGHKALQEEGLRALQTHLCHIEDPAGHLDLNCAPSVMSSCTALLPVRMTAWIFTPQ